MKIVPHGWPVKLAECPPGLFVFDGHLGFRSEYGDDAYVVQSGEYFWGGTDKRPERAELIVQPCITES